MVKFDYLPDGRIVGVRDIFSAFSEPSNPIPEITTHRHHRRDGRRAADQRGGRHGLRRRRGDRYRAPQRFRPKIRGTILADLRAEAWGCSATEIAWRKHGFAGAQLGYLPNGAGYFHAGTGRGSKPPTSTYTLIWESRNAHWPRQLQRSPHPVVFDRTTSFSHFWRHCDYADSNAAIAVAGARFEPMVGII
jgi:hypothetical protein